MRYKLGEWNGIAITGFGTLYFASLFVSFLVLLLLLKRRGQNLAPALDLTLLMLLAYTLGAHAFYALLDRSLSFAEWFTPKLLSAGLFGGPVIFGLLCVPYLLAGWASMRHIGDALAVTWAAVSIPHAIACFLSGCHYGAPSSVPWAVTFPPGGQCYLPGQPLHPSQLYDALAALVLTVGLSVAYWRRAGEGRLLLWWVFLLSLTQYASEWTRAEHRFAIVGPITASMLAEMGAAMMAMALLATPALWDSLVAWQEARARSEPCLEGMPGRGRLFARGILRFLVAACWGTLMQWTLRWEPAFYVAYFCLNIVFSLLGALLHFRIRIVDARGNRPGFFRIWIHGLFEALAPMGLVGLFRPLLDREGRSMGDAMAGLYRVRYSTPPLPVSTSSP
jgi:phosphatidylglycerol:prolipoprotein diacylglycerol transferase